MARRNTEKERIRNLIALDSDGVMKRLEERKDEMIAMFSLHRDREPLLSPLRSWVPSASFQELTQLTTDQQTAVSAFYEVLDGLRWYFRYTNDMPGTAQQVFAHHRREMERSFKLLRAALGPAVQAQKDPGETLEPVPPAGREKPRVKRRRKRR